MSCLNCLTLAFYFLLLQRSTNQRLEHKRCWLRLQLVPKDSQPKKEIAKIVEAEHNFEMILILKGINFGSIKWRRLNV
jgi:hypothetical protein